VKMARKSTQAGPAAYWMVGGLAALCLVLAVIAVGRGGDNAQPSQPAAAATATPQIQDSPVQPLTQAGSGAGTANQGTIADSSGPGQPAGGGNPPQQTTPVALQPAPAPAAGLYPDPTATLWPVTADP
jgi:hypothetical protein